MMASIESGHRIGDSGGAAIERRCRPGVAFYRSWLGAQSADVCRFKPTLNWAKRLVTTLYDQRDPSSELARLVALSVEGFVG